MPQQARAHVVELLKCLPSSYYRVAGINVQLLESNPLRRHAERHVLLKSTDGGYLCAPLGDRTIARGERVHCTVFAGWYYLKILRKSRDHKRLVKTLFSGISPGATIQTMRNSGNARSSKSNLVPFGLSFVFRISLERQARCLRDERQRASHRAIAQASDSQIESSKL